MVATILVWQAIYAGAGGDVSLGGYRRDEMIAYLLLVHISRMFSSMPGLANGIASDVRDGTIKKYLTQPVDMLTYLFCARVAHKLVYYFVATAPFALVFYLCRGYFAHAPRTAQIEAVEVR